MALKAQEFSAVSPNHEAERGINVRAMVLGVGLRDEGLEFHDREVLGHQAMAVMVDEWYVRNEFLEIAHDSLPVALVMLKPRWSHKWS